MIEEKTKEYLKEAKYFLTKVINVDVDDKSFINFILVYTIAFCEYHLKLNEWNNNFRNMNLGQLKKELQDKVNKDIFSMIDIKDNNLPLYINWIKKSPPIKSIDDILGSIYILCSKKKKRKELGEHYTRSDLIKLIENDINKENIHNQKVIDPACGSGNFLISLLNDSLCNKTDEDRKKIIRKLADSKFLIGVDIQEVPTIITKVRMLMEVISFQKNLIDPNIEFPVYTFNSLLTNNKILKDGQYDIVVTNPPYLRYQLIDKSIRAELKEKYQSATGRFDLYTLFIQKSIDLVKNRGKVVILCSDKFMSTAYGKGIREYINQNCQVSKVLDLSEIYPFEAAVLSAVYFLEKKKRIDIKPAWIKVLINENGLKTELQGYLMINDKWRYVDSESETVYNKIRNSSNRNLGDIVKKISIGVQTTADEVFCKKITNEFIEEKKLEKELLFPMLRGRNLEKWKHKWTGNEEGKDTYVLYPYYRIGSKTVPILLEEFPFIYQYLLNYKKELENRTYFKSKKNKMWFEHWTEHNYSLFTGIKILTPDLSSEPKFSLDSKGYFYNGTVYGIYLSDESSLSDYKFLLALLNSPVLNFYHKKLNSTHLHSNKYRFQSETMKGYPIVLLSKEDSRYKKIVKIVDLILNEKNEIYGLESKLNEIIYSIYNLNNTDIKIIEGFVCKRPQEVSSK